MIRYIRRRIAFAICICLLLTGISTVGFGTSTTVQAAALTISWYDLETETAMTVEAGSKFYISDYVMILSEDVHASGAMVKAAYASSDKKIATVNGKGYLNAKKAGIAEIRVTYQGKTLLCQLTVEKKGTFEKSKAAKKLLAAAKTLGKGLPTKLTTAKAYTLKKKMNAFRNSYLDDVVTKLSYEGFVYEKDRPAPGVVDYKRTDQLIVPEAGRYLTAASLLRQYRLTNDPTSVTSKKRMEIATATANSKGNKIQIRLKKNLTADQIYAAQLAYPRENSKEKSKTKANIVIPLYDETAGKYYTGQIVLKKGSKQLTVNPTVYTYGKYEKVKLEAGHTYVLDSALSWGNGMKVVAK